MKTITLVLILLVTSISRAETGQTNMPYPSQTTQATPRVCPQIVVPPIIASSDPVAAEISKQIEKIKQICELAQQIFDAWVKATGGLQQQQGYLMPPPSTLTPDMLAGACNAIGSASEAEKQLLQAACLSNTIDAYYRQQQPPMLMPMGQNQQYPYGVGQ